MADGPNTPNWKLVSPEAKRKLSGILKWARRQPKPFTQCKAALIKDGVPADRADKICGVMKDMALRRTTWRKGGNRG